MNWKVLTAYPDTNLEKKWNEFLANAEYPTHYTTPNFFVDPYIRGGERFAVLAFEGEDISAVLTGVDNGKTIISGMPVRPQTAFRKDVNFANAVNGIFQGSLEKGGQSLEMIEFYTWSPVKEFEDVGFQTQTSTEQNLVIMLDLSKGADEIFKDFSQTRRNELRKAMKQNLVKVKELETEQELKELYEIFVDWNQRKGHQPETFETMQFAVSQKNNRKVLIAKYEEKVIAGSYYRFCKGGVVEYAANNSLTEFQKLRPNDLIGWRSIEWACQSGFSHYSMGGSHLFLRRFGGNEIATHRYKLDRTFFKTHEKKEQLTNFAIKTYKSLPDSTRKKLKQVLGKS